MPELTFTRLGGSPDSPRLLVVGPSLGTSVEALWDRAAGHLDAEVVGWDLPGHGRSAPATAYFSLCPASPKSALFWRKSIRRDVPRLPVFVPLLTVNFSARLTNRDTFVAEVSVIVNSSEIKAVNIA